MDAAKFRENFVLITAILPRETAVDIIAEAVSEHIGKQVLLNARGTVFKDKWYQRLTPSISPEQTVLQLLVHPYYAATLMNDICKAGKLHQSGTGLIYSTRCEKAFFMEDPVHEEAIMTPLDESILFKNDLRAIFCIVQKDKAEQVAIAAIRAGAHGPTVAYGQGRGIREKMGLLRIAISPEKEIIRVVVDHYNMEAVFEAMVRTGKLLTRGMGYIYVVPVEKGIVNVPNIATGKNELAHLYQIIKAIDELKDGSSWRTQAGKNIATNGNHLQDVLKISCVVERGKGDELVQAAIDAGAPGATIGYGIEGGATKQGEATIALHRELEIIELVVDEGQVNPVLSAMIAAADPTEHATAYFYVQQVAKALTYTR